MVDKYLKPISMEHLAKPFVENKVTGVVLLGLEVRTLAMHGLAWLLISVPQHAAAVQ